MTFIAQGGSRTVTNGTVYDRRKVYEIVASATLDEVQSVWGTGEVERTGRKVTEDRTYHIVAVDEDLARALFEKHWGGEFQGHTLVSIRSLFVLDGEITTGHN